MEVRRARVREAQTSLEREKFSKYQGSARIRLAHLHFSSHEPRELDESNVRRLLNIFEVEGCQDSAHPIPALISRQAFNQVTKSHGILRDDLLKRTPYPHELTFVSDPFIQCLHGRHRVQASRRLVPPQLWWTVDLYWEDLNDDLRTVLVEEFSDEKLPSDGEIYRKIRQHSLRPLAADRWRACLSENKRYELERLLRRKEFTAAFDALLDIPGLWGGSWLGVIKDMLGLKCDEQLLHNLERIRKYWTGLFQGDRAAMQKVDLKDVKALERRAPGTSTSDANALTRQLLAGSIFSAFNDDIRAKISVRLRNQRGLVPTLDSFFQNLKYLRACALPIKSMITIPVGGTLYTAMQRIFDGACDGDECLIQESESDFRLSRIDRSTHVDLCYRQVFLYSMRHHRELLPGSTRVEPKKSDKGSVRAKSPDQAAFRGLAELMERLGFRTPETAKIKSSHPGHTPTNVPSNPRHIVASGSDQDLNRRWACPYDLSYEESKDSLYLDAMQAVDGGEGSGIDSISVRKSTYLDHFGRLEVGDTIRPTDTSDVCSLTQYDHRSSSEHICRQPEPDQEDDGELGGTNNLICYADAADEMRHAFDSPSPLPSPQGKLLGSCDDTRTTPWKVAGEFLSRSPSIGASSFYSEDSTAVACEEDSQPLDEADTPRRDSELRESFHPSLEKENSPDDSVRFMLRHDDHSWSVVNKLPSDALSASLVIETAYAHARQGRYLFDTDFWSLHPSQCYQATRFPHAKTILLLPPGRVCIDQQMVAPTPI